MRWALAALAAGALAAALWLALERSRPKHAAGPPPRPAAAHAPAVARRVSDAALRALPAAPRPAFRVGAAPPLAAEPHVTRWAVVREAVQALRAPAGGAVITTVEHTTPEGTTNLLEVRGRPVRAAGRLWVRALLAVLPNGTTGWVPRSALGGYVFVHTHLVVDRARLRATLYRNGRAVFRAAVGIGTPAAPTPVGRSYVRERITSLHSAFYGPFAFGTSARSEVLTDWPGGGFVGIHGTDRPDIIPGRVSHGCIRLRNADLRRLDALMPVGTPVTVR